jgi:hypothetical protein
VAIRPNNGHWYPLCVVVSQDKVTPPVYLRHALNNGLLFIYRDIFGLDIVGYTARMSQEIQFQPLWLDIVGLFLMVLGIWPLIRTFQQAGESKP